MDQHALPVLDVAAGLQVAQRGAAPTPRTVLQTADVAPVPLPQGRAQEALSLKGEVWRRLWVLPDRLVIKYENVAIVEVHDGDGRVVFDRPLAPDMEQHLLLDHVLPLALARRGEVVLHGAVVSLGDRAAVLVGPTGAGKSTLTAFLWQQGWTVGGDDGAVLRLGPPATAEATYPTVRLTPEAADLLDIVPEEGSEVVGKRRLRGRGTEAFRQRAFPLSLVLVLDPVDGQQTAALTPLRGAQAHAALFSSTFHLDIGRRDLLDAVVDRLAHLTEVVTVGRITVPRGLAGLAAVEALLRHGVATDRP